MWRSVPTRLLPVLLLVLGSGCLRSAETVAAAAAGPADTTASREDHAEPEVDKARIAEHPIVASPSPDHYRYSPVYNGDTWHFGDFPGRTTGSISWTYQVLIWNASDRPVKIRDFRFDTEPELEHGRGFILETGDTLWQGMKGHAAGDTIELAPEDYVRIALNLSYGPDTPPGDYLATIRLRSDPGGEYVAKFTATLEPTKP